MNAEAEVDHLIASWESRLARVDENLILLESDPTYQTLAGVAGQRAPLEGVTRARVAPALEALNELFEHRTRLTQVVDRAKEIRAGIGFWDKDELKEIQELFHGASIQLGTALTPLSRRNLLDPAASDVAVAPERLLSAMADAFHVARDAVADVARAQASLEPRLEAAERELATLAAEAEGLGDAANAAAELAPLESELARMRAELATDPLGVASNVDRDFSERLALARRRASELSAARDRVRAGLREARDLERAIEESHASARRGKDVAANEIEGAGLPEVADDALLAGLAPWLQKIAAAAAARHWRSADVGLGRWLETARGLLAADRAVTLALASSLEARAELEGRLSARRAQLDALAARGAVVDAAMLERARDAEHLLQARPTSLVLAADAVDRFEAGIAALAGRVRRG